MDANSLQYYFASRSICGRRFNSIWIFRGRINALPLL